MPFTSIQRLEHDILLFMSVGWSPSSGFGDAAEFNASSLLTRIPTREYPLTHLDDALCVALAYLVIIVVGKMCFVCRRARQSGPPSLLYSFKFIYNLCQIMLCSYMFTESLLLAVRNNYYFFPWTASQCNAFDFERPVFAKLLWLFYVSKIFDFFDTIFIIVGNKANQFTFLHCYHHITIFLVYWMNVNLTYDADIFQTITLNAFVHTVMYLYYLISMHMPNGKGIWWKKYLTLVQLIQFLIMIAHAFLVLANGCTATPPRPACLYFVYILSLFAMFLDFFRRSYATKSAHAAAASKTKKQ